MFIVKLKSTDGYWYLSNVMYEGTTLKVRKWTRYKEDALKFTAETHAQDFVLQFCEKLSVVIFQI